MPKRSVAVILSAGGAQLDLPALEGLPEARLVRAEIARGESAACVAATLEHECPHGELAGALRRWAAARGWIVTVAPVGGRE
jgi:hypothetical protein